MHIHMTYHITAHQQSSQQPLGPWVPALGVKVWPQTSDLGIRHAVPKLPSSASHVKTKNRCISGWWFQPLWKMEFVSWDDDIPNIWKNNPNVPNHQPNIDGFYGILMGSITLITKTHIIKIMIIPFRCHGDFCGIWRMVRILIKPTRNDLAAKTWSPTIWLWLT